MALKEAIVRDWKYWSVVAVDSDFDLVRQDVISLQNKLREQEKK